MTLPFQNVQQSNNSGAGMIERQDGRQRRGTGINAPPGEEET
jgi:hypothetical protein